MSALLEVQQLRAVFALPQGEVTALRGVSFQLQAGETLGLVGESGCGKTVTALSILRLLPAPFCRLSGRVSFQGRELTALPINEMRRIRGNKIAMIFQEPMTALNPVLTVGEQIAEVLRWHRRLSARQAWEEARACLAKVGMPDPKARLAQYPHQLSGGLRQRVLIAMALACQPQLLIADEPTTALDVTIQAQILTLIAELQAALQMGLLLITHNLGVVAQIAARVAVMYAGVIVEQAPTLDLFDRPYHPYTQGLLASVPKLDFHGPRQQLAAIPGQVPDLGTILPGCLFQPRCPVASSRCQQPPPWLEVAPGHQVSCWLYH